MFQFTTTNVINSASDFTTGKALWSSKAGSFFVKRVNNFLTPNVLAVYKSVAHDPEFVKATIDLSQITSASAGKTYRLFIYLGLSQASQSSLYANDLQYKGKPLSIDFVWKDSAANTAESLSKIINKYETMVYNKKLLNVSYSGTCLTVEGTDEYQRFVKFGIEEFDSAAYHGMGEYKEVRTLEDLVEKDTNAGVTATAEGFFPGKEGFGTYAYLMHNLRLPTYARNRWQALNQDETPIVGAKYNQYVLYYCVNRGVLGDNAVGDLVKSRTTHVFYVKSDIAGEFETAMETAGLTLTEVEVTNESKVPDPGPGADDIDALQEQITQLQSQLQTKQNSLSAGNGINIAGDTVSVKLDGDTLSASADGLKVTDGKFTEA